MFRTIMLTSFAALLVAVPQLQAQDEKRSQTQELTQQQRTQEQDRSQKQRKAGSQQDKASGEVTFVGSLSADEWLTADIVGRDIKNSTGESVGDVNALVIGSNHEVTAVVIGVGGFLGIGEKRVALKFDEINRNRDEDGELTLVANVTKQQLEAAPEFQGERSSSTMDRVEDEASEAGKQIKDAAKRAAEEAQEMGETAADTAQKAANAARDKAEEMMTDEKSGEQQQ